MLKELINVIPEVGRIFSEDFEETESQVNTIFKHLESSFPKGSEVILEVTYEELINWFINQPRHPELKRGAVLRRYCSNKKIAIIQVFLNESNEVIERFEGKVYGRKLICSSIDEELAETFSHNNLILIN